MKFSEHPLWLVGFRPFFALACLSGLSLPVIWALAFTGKVAMPQLPFTAVQWHAHEMFFGFGWAVLGGFLLTSTKNWTNIRGYHGGALVFLVAAWLFERAGMWFAGAWPPILFRISNNLFLVSIVAMVLWTLIRHRKTDSYRDNYFFLIILPLFLISKNLLLSADWFLTGASMAIGLFRVAFLVMLERTLSTFMKAAFQVEILRHPVLDRATKLTGLALIAESFMPPWMSAWLSLLLAVLLGGRFFFWKPQLAMRRIDIGIVYLGYIAIIVQLVFEFLKYAAYPTLGGSLSVHVFTFGVMGLVIPSMIIRITKGHTGRKVVFDSLDKWALRIMILAFALRLIAPQLYPSMYPQWIALAAVCWFACFAMIAWRYIPFVLQARVDGKVH